MDKSQAARLDWKLGGIVENQLASVANNKSGSEMLGHTPKRRRRSSCLTLENTGLLLCHSNNVYIYRHTDTHTYIHDSTILLRFFFFFTWQREFKSTDSFYSASE